MQRVAVFVDAPYLFQAGGFCLTGGRQERVDLLLSVSDVIAELKFAARALASGTSFLRIYWYDVLHPGARLTSDQALLASSDEVKIRLCSSALLSTCRSMASSLAADLVELARNHALSDAVIVSGDEELRVAVQLAQTYGVRVHLLGLATGKGALSTPLMQEVDTNMEWQRDTAQRFLLVRRTGLHDCGPAPSFPQTLCDPQVCELRLESAAREFADALDDNDLDSLEAYWATSRGVPSELDRRLLPFARSALGRDLDQAEKRFVRSCFQRQVMERFDAEDAEDAERVD